MTRPAADFGWLIGGTGDPWYHLLGLWNLVLLCGRHHRVIHHEGWEVRIDENGLPVFRPPRWIDPDQTEQPSWNTTWQHALDHIPIRT